MTKKQILFLLPALSLAFLIFLKAFISPFTHDESLSFLNYSSKSITSILSFKEEVSANNHIINSLFLKFISSIGIEQVGMLRLLSSLSFLLLLYSLWKMLKLENNLHLGLLCLIACCNPYLLDFFAMARGYAVSFGLMAFSLYLFFKEENESSKMWSMQVATLAMIANFNLVYFWVSLGFLHFFWLLSSSQKNLKTLFMNYGFPLLSLVYLFIVFKRLSEAQQLYFGGKEGIVENVVNDQLWCFIYDNSYLYNETFLFIWQILPLAMLAIALAFTTNRKVRSNVLFQNWVKVLFVLLFSLLLIELNHRFTGSLYPIKRTGLFMSLLYGICFMLFIRFLSSIKPIQFVVLIFAYSFSAVLFFHTISSFDRMRFREIAYDSHHHEILDRLAHEVKDTNKELDLSANWQVGPSLNFYRKTKNLNWLPQINRDPVRRNAKYLLVFEDDLVNLNKDSLSPLLSYPEDGVYLFTHKTFE